MKRGLTLVEVLVALLVGAVTVTLAHRVFGSVAAASSGIEAQAEAGDRRSNGRRLLGNAIASMEVGVVADGGFSGGAHAMRFSAWLPDTRGWPRRVRVAIVVASPRLLAILDADSIVLATDVTEGVVEYLLDLGVEQTWHAEWRSRATAPAAVRLRVGRDSSDRVDTLLFAVGPRG